MALHMFFTVKSANTSAKVDFVLNNWPLSDPNMIHSYICLEATTSQALAAIESFCFFYTELYNKHKIIPRVPGSAVALSVLPISKCPKPITP